MTTNTPKKLVQSTIEAQDATFDMLAAQARMLGFDECLLILSNSRSENLKLVRFRAVSESRAAVVVGEAEQMMLEKMVPKLSRPAKTTRPPSGGKAVS